MTQDEVNLSLVKQIGTMADQHLKMVSLLESFGKMMLEQEEQLRNIKERVSSLERTIQ